ncbi:MAG: hypothetical protein K0R66_1492 [Gammaproteobacteria bacterium]|jgi:hypothetical protein|nr:hypothetical protein [Gammaproteobacteria bacterium]
MFSPPSKKGKKPAPQRPDQKVTPLEAGTGQPVSQEGEASLIVTPTSAAGGVAAPAPAEEVRGHAIVHERALTGVVPLPELSETAELMSGQQVSEQDKAALAQRQQAKALLGTKMKDAKGAAIGAVDTDALDRAAEEKAKKDREAAEAARKAREEAARRAAEAEAARKAAEDEAARKAAADEAARRAAEDEAARKAAEDEAARKAAADEAARQAAEAAAAESEGPTAPLLGAAAVGAGVAAAGSMDWLTKWRDEQGKIKKAKVGATIGTGLAVLGLIAFLIYWFWPKSNGILIQNQRTNTTIYDGEVAYPLNTTSLSGHDQAVTAVLLFAYTMINNLVGNFTLDFAGREALVDARNVNGNFSAPFGSLAEANNAFAQTQAIAAGNQEAGLDLSIYAIDSKNRHTDTVTTHTHYIPGPPPALPLIISGGQNGSFGPGQNFKPYPNFNVQNLGEADPNSLHFSLGLDTQGQATCQFTVNGQSVASVNSTFPKTLGTINYKGAGDLTAGMQGASSACTGDNATISHQIFDTAGNRSSDIISSQGTYVVPPTPGPSPSPTPSPTPPPKQCNYVLTGPVSYTTLANVPFNPFENNQLPQLNASASTLSGKFGYCYLAPANVYTGFADMGCSTEFGNSTYSGSTRYCITSTGGLNVDQATQLFAKGIPLQLLAGTKKGNTYPVSLVFQSDQADCPQNQTGIVAVIYPALKKAKQGRALDIEKDVA